MKRAWGARLTTVFPRQGQYAHDPKIVAANPTPDVTIERIGDLLAYDLPTLLALPDRPTRRPRQSAHSARRWRRTSRHLAVAQ